MRSVHPRLLAAASLALGSLLPVVRAADAPPTRTSTDPGVRPEFRQLLQDVDLFLQASAPVPGRRSDSVAVRPEDRVRRAARRFASDRLARLEAESPLSPEERAEWREAVRRHGRARGEETGGPWPRPAPEGRAAAPPVAGGHDLQAAGTGVVSGRVTSAATGSGIGGSAVLLYLGYSSTATTVYTDAAGSYTFTGLATGTYYVKTNNFAGYVDEAWNNVPCDYTCRPVWSGGTAIAVTSGATTSGIDFALVPGGRIAGTVVDAATSTPIANLAVTFWEGSAYRRVTYAYTDAAGTFVSYGGLVSGKFRVRTETSMHGQAFVDEVYDDIPCPLGACSASAGTLVTVTPPATTGGIDFALDPGGGLAGRVTEAGTSTGLPGVRVIVRLVGGNGTSVTTDASGHWATLLNAPAGSYLASTGNDSGYVDEIWNDVPCPGGGYGGCGGAWVGTPITVSAQAVTSGIDFALDVGGRVTGRVTDALTDAAIAWAEVDIYTENSRSYVAYGYTDASGDYVTSTGLPTGRYRAQTNAWGYYGTGTSGYLDEVYDDKPCAGHSACRLAEGTSVEVALGATTSGVDFALGKGGHVAGTVTDASTAAGVAEVYVDIYSETGQWRSYGYTDGAGRYTTFWSVPPGRYYASTNDVWASGAVPHVNEAYANVPCAACRPDLVGTAINVATGATTPGIDFALDRGGAIAGQVTSAADGTGIAGTVVAYATSGSWVRRTTADAGGHYTLGGLPTDRYVVRTSVAKGFVEEVFDDRPCVGNTCDLTAGTLVAVTAGATTAADFVLSPGARVAGRVTDGATGGGLAGVTVGVLKPPSGTVASLTTDRLGYFATTAGSGYGLPTGGYYVRTGNAQGYRDELFDDVPCAGCDVTAGTKVQLTSGATTSGIDFALGKVGGGRIAGRVTRQGSGEPLPLLAVRVYGSTGGLVASLTTDFLGSYRSETLPLGTYYVAATVDTANYVDELYDDVPFCPGCSPTTGTPVAIVADGSTVSGIDIALDAGGRIEGRVTDASTGAPLLDASVSVYDATGALERTALVDAVGDYAAHGLASGTHYAVAGAGSAYVRERFADTPCPACSPQSGTPIVVTAGGPPVTGIDFTLGAGGRIEGHVTRASDGTAAGAVVTIHDATGAAVAGSVQDSSGLYRSASGLPSGTYYALASDQSGALEAELYDDRRCRSCDPTTGTAVAVTSPAATTGIDFALASRSLEFFTLKPCRVVDSRDAPSALGGPALASREDRILSVFARCGIPLTARALSVNVTATGSTGPGHLRLHPGDRPVPTSSSVNFTAGLTRANNAVVPLSRFGELGVYGGQAAGAVHFVIDVNGYFE